MTPHPAFPSPSPSPTPLLLNASLPLRVLVLVPVLLLQVLLILYYSILEKRLRKHRLNFLRRFGKVNAAYNPESPIVQFGDELHIAKGALADRAHGTGKKTARSPLAATLRTVTLLQVGCRPWP